jgi:hypothetical protein
MHAHVRPMALQKQDTGNQEHNQQEYRKRDSVHNVESP